MAVAMGPRDAEGLAAARVTVVATPGCHHNKVTKVTPEVIFVDLGVPKAGSRANVELLGFLASILELQEEQVRLESGRSLKGKVVVLSGLTLERKELVWRLEGQVGRRHEPHFAADDINAARNLNSRQAVTRRKELDEFQSLRDEALHAVAATTSTRSHLLLGTPAPRKAPPTMAASGGAPLAASAAAGSSSAAKRCASAGTGAGVDAQEAAAEEPTTKRPRTGDLETQATGAPEASVSVATTGERAASAEDAMRMPSLGGLAAYDSEDEDTEDEEKVKLPPPELGALPV